MKEKSIFLTYNPCEKLAPPPGREEEFAAIIREYEEKIRAIDEDSRRRKEDEMKTLTLKLQLLYAQPQCSRPVPTIDAAVTEIENLYVDWGCKKWTVRAIIDALHAYGLLQPNTSVEKDLEKIRQHFLKHIGEDDLPSTRNSLRTANRGEMKKKYGAVCALLERLGFVKPLYL